MTKDKYVIKESDIRHIRSKGLERFHERKGFGTLDNKEIQILLILEGLEDFLKSKNIDPPFQIKFDPYKIGE